MTDWTCCILFGFVSLLAFPVADPATTWQPATVLLTLFVLHCMHAGSFLLELVLPRRANRSQGSAPTASRQGKAATR